MKGWVYVISNQAMPDLVKVGFSTKDPTLRASELNHTGSPHPYVGVVVSFLALAGFAPKLSFSATVFWSLVVGVVGGLIGKGWQSRGNHPSFLMLTVYNSASMLRFRWTGLSP